MNGTRQTKEGRGEFIELDLNPEKVKTMRRDRPVLACGGVRLLDETLTKDGA